MTQSLFFRWILVLTLFALVACAPPAEPPADSPAQDPPSEAPVVTDLGLPDGAEAAEAAITGDYLREVIAVLADDKLEGRGPGTPGDEEARKYMAEQMAAIGLEPGGPDGSWEQVFDIVSVTSEGPKEWVFKTAAGEVAIPFWDGYIATSGVQEATASINDAELVFVGYGIEAPEYEWNDFKGRDLTGKVLVMLNNDPDWDDHLFEGHRRLYYGRWSYKYESAERQGAAGAIILHTTESAGYPFQVVQTSWTGPQLALPATGDGTSMPIEAWLTYEAAENLLAQAGQDLNALVESARSQSFEPVDLGIRTSLTLTNAVESDVRTANVLGLLRGSDPELSQEAVIYTAHHDHLGRGTPGDDGDDIYNGARDNASGVAQVLAAARAFKALPTPPKRSILFALVGAEEQGLLGSRFYADFPTFAPGRLAANINFDAGNIWGPTEDLVYIGYGKSSLDRVVELAAERQERYVVGDLFPDRGFFYRSDQFSLAKIGVPAVYLDGGTSLRGADAEEGRKRMEEWEATRYHQPNDELEDDWNFDGMVEDTRVGFISGLSIAETATLPAWNPGDEFEAARLAALKAVAEEP